VHAENQVVPCRIIDLDLDAPGRAQPFLATLAQSRPGQVRFGQAGQQPAELVVHWL
jgi:hypothetical protein